MTLSIMTLSIMILNKMTLSIMTFSTIMHIVRTFTISILSIMDYTMPLKIYTLNISKFIIKVLNTTSYNRIVLFSTISITTCNAILC